MDAVAVRTRGGELAELASSSRLGTACFRAPEEVAEYHAFQPGDFWLGRCPVSGAPLGHSDDRHVLLCSGSREGKGTGTIIPNLCLWPGSAVVIDPKGEEATITAARRGAGSEYAEGMGQDVYVLDGFGVSQVAERYRVKLNPLDALDIEAPDFITKLKALAVALMPLTKQETDNGIWTKVGRRLLMNLITHVLTCEDFEGRRDLVTVRRLLTLGDYELAKTLEDAGEKDVPSPFALLWESMRMNHSLGGVVSAAGQNYIDNAKNNPKRNEDIRMNAIEETDFLDAKQFQWLMGESDFSLDELKTNPNGITIYLCLPFTEIGSYYPWLRLMVTLCLSAAQKDDRIPACGHRTLFCLDEFASLQHMQPVQDAMAQIAGYHVTMFLVVQGLEQLEEIYGKGWEVFTTNCGLQIHFGVGRHTAEYLSRTMGEAEVIRSAEARSESVALGESSTLTASHTDSESSSRTKGRSLTTAETRTINRSLTHTTSESNTDSTTKTAQAGVSHAKNRSASVGGGTSSQWGRNWNESLGKFQGESSGTNTSWNKGRSGGESKSEGWGDPGHGILGDVAKFIPWIRNKETVSYQAQDGWSDGQGGGTNKSRNSGTNASKGRGGSESGGTNSTWNRSDGEADTASRSTSTAKGRSVNCGTSKAETTGSGSSSSTSRAENSSETTQTGTSHTTAEAKGVSETRTKSRSVNESVHKRPLMTPDEIQVVFSREDEKSRPGVPAWGLVLVKGHRAALIHRSPYFRDVGFRWLFDPDPKHAGGSKLNGPIRAVVPSLHAPELKALEASVNWLVEKGGRVDRGEPLLTVDLPAFGSYLSPGFVERHTGEVQKVTEALCGSADLSASRSQIPVFAEVTGTLRTQRILEADDEEGPKGVVMIAGNRRHHLEVEQEALPNPMAEYLKYLNELHARQCEEEAEIRAHEERVEALRTQEREKAEASARERRRREVQVAWNEQTRRVDPIAKSNWWQDQVRRYEPIRRALWLALGFLVLAGVWPFVVKDVGVFAKKPSARVVEQFAYHSEYAAKHPSFEFAKENLEEARADLGRKENQERSKLAWFLFLLPTLVGAAGIAVCLTRGEFLRYLQLFRDRRGQHDEVKVTEWWHSLDAEWRERHYMETVRLGRHSAGQDG